MAKCVRCGKKGFFLRVNQAGVCPDCVAEAERQRQLKEKEKRIKETQRLFALQKLFYGETYKQLLPTQDIVKGVNMYCQPRIYHVQSSQDVINTTNNPDTFYHRVDFLRQRLIELQKVEKIDSKLFPNDKPSDSLKKLDEQLPSAEATMWNRCYQKYMADADKLVTEKGKQRKIAAFFELASRYNDKVGSETMRFFDDKCREHNLQK